MSNNQNNLSRVENPKLYNPYSYHRPHFIRWRGSVIPKVLPSTFVVTLVAVIVCVVNLETKVKISIPSTFIPVLGFVVGLLLTYRTNTAYDRYWEGRRLWAVMVVAIRNLTRNIWVNIKEDDGKNDLLEKKTAINLLIGFAIATKHYLREEDGLLYDDLKPLISNIKSNLPGFKPLNEMDPSSEVNHNLPLEITLYLCSYIDNKRQSNKVDVPTTNSMYGALNTLIDCLTQFERILRSPIPLAYSIHLSQTVWIYCLSLPFQLVDNLKYITILIVFLASFILMGILHIGGEIENPFGYDENDLDLDDFCGTIKRELNVITSRKRPTVDDWVYNPENHPFGREEITASEARKLSIDEVRSLLHKENERNSIENNITRDAEAIEEEKDEKDGNSNVTIKVD
ncbi:hypothetical protein RclHR1_12010003 [Rhizophagus clarus]|uniref:Bestrophin, RFP-TM, chloride channel-domain-containing protein n=1 Tax=Rhizophagus clarus TaxID=94130 RepID=A0A2Z6QAP8_9GLOM|nr:hypothetical protein RclHR1_12010003 [Rhizophagus clarus]GES86849.1 bestrophin, RFP-TM, chloride channel-domain-containing protein [Rhizophagus clarus]